MPKKKVPESLVIPEPEPSPPITPPPASASIQVHASVPLSQIIQIMRNGSINPFFPAHSGLLLKILHAYNARNTPLFLAGVQDYLEQAVAHVAQAGRHEEIPQRMKDITDLIEAPSFTNGVVGPVGLVPVAQRMLRVIYATL